MLDWERLNLDPLGDPVPSLARAAAQVLLALAAILAGAYVFGALLGVF